MKVIYDKKLKRGKKFEKDDETFYVICLIAVLGYFGFLHMKISGKHSPANSGKCRFTS